MPLITLALNLPMDVSFLEIVHSEARLLAHPLTKALAAPFTAMRADRANVHNQELALVQARYAAIAKVDFIDWDLDGMVDEGNNLLLAEVKNDKSAPLYDRFMNGRRPSDIKKPTLGPELEILRMWPGGLKECASQGLKDLGVRLQAKVTEADDAVKARGVAAQDELAFATTGARKLFIDKLNSLRKTTWAALASMVHDHPEYHLPKDFADWFFRHETRSKTPTSADVETRIKVLDTELQSQRAVLADMKAREDLDARAQADAELQANKAALAAARKRAENESKLVAELEGKIGGK